MNGNLSNHEWLEEIGRPRILVLGDLILDRYTWGDAERVSPEAPVLVLRVDTNEVRLGGAASVAMLLHALETEVTLAGVVGDDPEGRALRALLKDDRTDSELVIVDPSRPTTTKERFVGRAANRATGGGHQILRVDHETRNPIGHELEEWLVVEIVARLDRSTKLRNQQLGFDAILVSDYAKGVCTPRLVQMVVAKAGEKGIPVVIDPARIADYSRYRGATLLKPNRVEAELATGAGIDTPEEALSAAGTLRERYDLGAVLLTLDRDGVVLVDAASCRYFPTTPRAVYDITGAGDMVLATLGLCLAGGVALPDGVPVANVAAGLEVEKLGVAPISREELRRALECLPLPLGEGRGEGSGGDDGFEYHGRAGKPIPQPHSSSKLTTLAALLPRLDAYRHSGKKLVFTNGCFDLLHFGHVTCLQEAAALGDVLIVALNSDVSVRRLKGAGRPVIPEDQRAAIVAALDCVDHVLIFDQSTPHALLEALRPDFLVKGGTTSAVVGQEVVEAYGGRVCRLCESPGISTTTIVSRIQDVPPRLPMGEGRGEGARSNDCKSKNEDCKSQSDTVGVAPLL